MAAGAVGGASDSCKLLVAAIDFGTTYSGWACSFKHEYAADPTKISSKQWYGGQHVSLKAPTTVLIKPDGRTLEAFGYDAENRYAELAADEAHRNYFYFKRFKMMLYDKINLSRNITLEDDKGLSLPAKTVFSLAIRYLKEDMLDTCSRRLASSYLSERDVQWVITVPAIWNDSAKQFMREAAVAAGIGNEQLTIALEPEAASVYCRLLPVEKLVQQTKGSTCMSAFQPGAKYMVLDAGGGTVDVTVHEVMEGGALRELHKASGGAWGGTKVDECFKQFIIKIVGAPAIRRFQFESTDDYLDMFREFEVKKRDITPCKDNRVTVRMATALRDIFVEETEEDMKETLRQTPFSDCVSLSGDKLRVDPSLVKKLFSDAIDSIVSHVRALLREPEVRGTNTILMVGGFSESPMLQDAIRSSFPRMRVIVPTEAGLVVLKGAVIYGHKPSFVAERVCKYTYGVQSTNVFQEGKHDINKKTVLNGKEYCKDVFDKHVEIGQMVKFGEPQSRQTYTPLEDNQEHVTFVLYASTNKCPQYTTDPGMHKLGQVTIQVRDTSVPLTQRNMTVTMTFSGTEIEMRATEDRTGNVVNVTTDFLG